LWQVALVAPEGKKGLALGFVGLARLVPIVLAAFWAGVLADAMDRRKLMLWTQGGMFVAAFGLAVVSLADRATLPWIYALSAVSALAGAFDGPVRSALVPTLVPRAHIGNAVSLNTLQYQLAWVIGPGLAGLALTWVGPGWIYLANALSFLPVVVALRVIRTPAVESRARAGLRAAVDALSFVARAPLIRSAILLDFVAGFFVSATTMLPIFAQDVLSVGPLGYGILHGAPAVGAVLASAWMVRQERRIHRRGEWLLGSVGALGLATVAFGTATAFVPALLALAAIGACDTVNMVLRNVIRQVETPDHLRGRVAGVNYLFAQGGPQLGEFEAGAVAQAFGVRASIVSGGLLCLAATTAMAWRSPLLRRPAEPVLRAAPATVTQ
jgi:MFS family permease